MSGTTRKVKNPLLTAAGVGFPFENYTENPLLVPVTPATPAVLRDDGELDSFVGEEKPRIQPTAPPTATVELAGSNTFSGVNLQAEGVKDSSSQPAKQGYFTSILSSLPNLSLSSAKGESSQTTQGQEIIDRSHDGKHPLPQKQYHGSLPNPPPSLGAFQATNLSESAVTNFGPPGPVPAPPQQTLPPTAPVSAGGQVSYRLGNQRRLKYAPPPDLTSSAPKQYPPVGTQTFLPSQISAPPSVIFNPNAPAAPDGNPISQITSDQSARDVSQSYPDSKVATNPTLTPQNLSAGLTQQSDSIYGGKPPTSTSSIHQKAESNPSFVPSVVPASTIPSTRVYEAETPQIPRNPYAPGSSTYPFAAQGSSSVLTSQNNLPPPRSNLDVTCQSSSVDQTATSRSQVSNSEINLGPSVNVSTSQTSLRTHDATSSRIVKSPSFEQLSQGSSVQGSFRSSPIGTRASSVSGLTPQSSYSDLISVPGASTVTSSAHRAIPSRFVEPATPQNTPATGFSGFAAFFKERDHSESSFSDNLAVLLEGKVHTDQVLSQPEVTKDAPPELAAESVEKDVATKSETIFTPISAAKVYEKLEHLLAEQEEASHEEQPNNSAESSDRKNEESEGLAENLELLHSAQPSSQEIKETFPAQPVHELESIDLKADESPSDESLSNASKVPLISQQFSSVSESYGQSRVPGVNTEAHLPQQFFDIRPPTISKTDLNLPDASQTSIPSSFFDSVGGLKQQTSEQTNPPSSLFNFFDQKVSNAERVEPISQRYNVTGNPQSASGINTGRNVDSSAASFVPFTSAVFQPPYWSNNQIVGSTNVSGTQSAPEQQPQFYNPAQFMSGSNTAVFPSTDYFTAPPAPSTYNQINPHLVDAPGSLPVFGADNSAITSPSVLMATTAVPEPSGSATLSPVQISVNPGSIGRSPTDTIPLSFQKLASADQQETRMQYRAVYHHWFFRKEVENKVLWIPFSMQDSLRLEEVHNSSEISPETLVPTDGGRYDVDILRRQRSPVYWTGPSAEVRRCSWFYKGPSESRCIPYEESIALKLEEEYKQACLTNIWNRRVDLNNGEYVIFHSANIQVHYTPATSSELAASWGNSIGSEDGTYLQGAVSRPRVVKRGVDEFNIDEGEPEKVDHLLFLVHGIGSVCDLKFRSVEEVVDEFRSISLQLVQSHYRTASEQGIVNRIELLPISWHTTLHGEDTGIDKKLQAITLESIPKLRHFTNDTLLDILFYTSPIYCQTIMQTVGSEMNRLYDLFKQRNPDFNGNVCLGGHSLGSLILFDLLCHQKPAMQEKTDVDEGEEANSDKKSEDENSIKPMPAQVLKRRLSKKISYVMGAAGTGQPYIHYPQLNFHPRAFFALGSPIGMFVTVRGIDTLGEDFALPTCPAFFNVFHPFDPVAYRVESLINPEAHKFRPMLIPHHKGRKRMHLELKETMARVGADLKQKLLDSVRSTWNSVYQLAMFHKPDNQTLEREIDKVVEEQLQKSPSVPEQLNTDDGGANLKIGKLNGGRRIDYVLQEAPFEYINEYLFALTSHVCYWESEDTMLMILKEIYGSTGIQTDAQLPQQTMSIERVTTPPSPTPSTQSSASDVNNSAPLPPMGVDPTAPISGQSVGPPPKTGFVRKT